MEKAKSTLFGFIFSLVIFVPYAVGLVAALQKGIAYTIAAVFIPPFGWVYGLISMFN